MKRSRELAFVGVLVALVAVCLVAVIKDNAVATPAPDTTRTYRFAARVQDNGGVTPFRLGSTVRGQFTYDMSAKNQEDERRRRAIANSQTAKAREDERRKSTAKQTPEDVGRFVSPHNRFSFSVDDLHFTGAAGKVAVTTAVFRHAEHFQIVAYDLDLPRGWDMKHDRGQSYGILLQNAPPRGVVKSAALPNRLPPLASFGSGPKDTRELSLGFYPGVSWPGGRIDKNARVRAVVEELEPVEN
jgi:hypothetical protein